LRNNVYTKKAKKRNTPLAFSVNGSTIGSTSVYFGEYSQIQVSGKEERFDI
jgi:hypothetical protein